MCFYRTAFHIRHQKYIQKEVLYLCTHSKCCIAHSSCILVPGTIEYLLLHASKSKSSFQYSRSDWTNRMGRIILFLYNTVQMILEIVVIVIVIKLTVIEDNNHVSDCQVMIAHYLFFLSRVNQCAFFGIACIFAKLTKKEYDWERHNKPSSFRNLATFLFPIINWVCTKYKYHFVFTILVQSILTMLSPLIYFYSFIDEGTTLKH